MLTVFLAFLRLGLTSFGGPVAHLGYFRAEFVERRRWLTEQAYADLVGFCQILPGPASSQVAIGIGLRHAGLAGAFAAWIGFTAPSAVAMVLAAYGIADFGAAMAPWLHGLRVIAVAVVALAVWTMARSLAPDRLRAAVAVAAVAIVFAVPGPAGQVGAIVLGAIVGRIFGLPDDPHALAISGSDGKKRRLAVVALTLFVLLLAALPVLANTQGNQALRLFDAFYRSGSLVFGGGHVVLPLLRAEVVPSGWVSDGAFMSGYGLAQAMPGPLFSFAAYLGAASGPEPHGWLGGALAIVAIYLPSFLLVIGILPFWEGLRGGESTRSALRGINASVVGLLLAALFDPVWITAIHSRADFMLAAVALLLLGLWKVPAWLVVVLGAVAGYALDRAATLLG